MATRRSQTLETSSALIHALLGMKAGTSTPESIRALFAQVLEASGLDHDQRVEVLGGALVAEAVRPYWEAGHGAEDAHQQMRRNDAELADVIEALSPVLLARAEAKGVARELLREVESLLSDILPAPVPAPDPIPEPPAIATEAFTPVRHDDPPADGGQFSLFGS